MVEHSEEEHGHQEQRRLFGPQEVSVGTNKERLVTMFLFPDKLSSYSDSASLNNGITDEFQPQTKGRGVCGGKGIRRGFPLIILTFSRPPEAHK